ncbi:MAG: FtsQ-type POTRA domain-containing protein [Clostridium sp.]|uniref:cell division protein FtsQ/DivIB n=1 Tax=Clostridium sp. TaxID=1506 RepID=UPI0025C106D2|nr:FtsQ-type POTRA domain-containing protein [Clostridium sp.]MCF0149236.1 FtsQ-type POTRA domain-containing protein [Clostridium sp.]
MNTNVNKFLIKKKRKKLIKRIVLGLFVFIIGIIIFIYKAPIFNLKKINITGLVTISNESLQEKLKYNLGQNIFTLDYNKMEKELKTNPYIQEVNIKKKGIGTINISVIENKIAFYLISNNKIKAINNEGVIVEELDDLGDRKLTKLSGIDVSEKTVGSKIFDDNELPEVLGTFYKMIEVIPEELKISEINILDLNNIICYVGNVEIILGDSLDLIDKVNIALNLIEQGTITKGYIDLSLEGTPVIKQS